MANVRKSRPCPSVDGWQVAGFAAAFVRNQSDYNGHASRSCGFVGYKPPEAIPFRRQPYGWNTFGVGPVVVHIGAAVKPAGSDSCRLCARSGISIEDTGWVGHGCLKCRICRRRGNRYFCVREERFAASPIEDPHISRLISVLNGRNAIPTE